MERKAFVKNSRDGERQVGHHGSCSSRPPPPPLCTPSVSQRSEVLAEFWTRLRQKGTQYLFFCVEKMPFLFLFII